MAPPDGPRSDHLTRLKPLIEQPEQQHILHALRLFEAVHADTPRLGESRRARQDRIRLGQEAELSFPPSTIRSFSPGHGQTPSRLINRFFGFFGPQGPLPLHLTEYARDRQRNHRDPTLVAFADTLTHRFLSLFYRAWASAEPAPSFDRGEDGPFERHVAAISGLQGTAFRDRDAFPDLSKRHFAGLLGQGSKSPDGLVAILSTFFGASVRLQQFIGSWLELEPDDRWQLGAQAGLGEMTTIGERVWTRSAKFRLRIGPMDLEQYERLLPGSESLKRLRDIVRSYTGFQLDWDLNLVLLASEVPRAQLGRSTRLGQTSWIRGDAANRKDASDLFLYSEMI